jgi:hypothetical protein
MEYELLVHQRIVSGNTELSSYSLEIFEDEGHPHDLAYR